jgi:L,D-transpeptidase YcbB
MKSPFLFLCFFLLLSGCGLSLGYAESPVDHPADTFSLANRELLRNRLEAAGMPARLQVGGERVHSVTALPEFYLRRIYHPAWSRHGEPLPAARELVAAISEAHLHGFSPEHYHKQQIERLLQQLPDSNAKMRLLVDLDLLLTDAYLLLASHYQSGRINPETIDPEWRARRRNGDPMPVLERALVTGTVAESLRSLLPRPDEYAGLCTALQHYRELLSHGGWPQVPDGTKLEEGMRGERVTLLRQRLAWEDRLLEVEGELFDAELVEAVRRFQRRHGLHDDGVVGRHTLVELNVPTAERVRQLEVNLERWRWLPAELGPRYVLVNIASFQLFVVEENETVLDMRVVVGRPYRRTPVFSDRIRYLVLNPDWQVPEVIARKDIVPLVRKDPAYLERMRFAVLQGWGAQTKEIQPAAIDWRKVNAERFPYRLRQEPGPNNALGRIKFMFPNSYNVYLHDSPARELFRKDSRSFSSGCIRVEKPLELATYLLGGTPLSDLAALKSALDAGATLTVQLPTPVPVHLLYWTAWVDGQGVLHFRPDIYGRDRTLRQALDLPPPRP